MTAHEDGNRKKRIAIGCQGGGVHTAFVAGALKRLLREEKHEVVALSGASGGAICAALAWYALILENDRAEAAEKAAELLDSFWEDNSASEAFAKFWNDLNVWETRLQGNVSLLEVSPYDSPLSDWIRNQLRRTLERQPVDFASLNERLDSTSPVLLVSAIDVISGDAKNFDSREGEISIDALLAATAVPPVFKAAHIDGGVYWDALFCQNPPLRDLARMQPDEIWTIQVTPWSRGFEPKTIADINDRRNELSGNIAMSKDLYVIEKINQLVDRLGEGENPQDKRLRLPEGENPGEESREYRHIDLRVVEMASEVSHNLDFASKIDRSPSFIRSLMDHGEQRAEEVLKG